MKTQGIDPFVAAGASWIGRVSLHLFAHGNGAAGIGRDGGNIGRRRGSGLPEDIFEEPYTPVDRVSIGRRWRLPS